MSTQSEVANNKRLDPGALPAAGVIPLCVPEMGGNEWAYIKECLDTGWVSSVGSYVDRFEADVAHYTGTKYGVATVNGTAALHIALLVAGVEPDDEVLVSALTFVAPVNAIRYVGAWPVFMDADPDYWQMDPEKVKKFLETECHWVGGELRNRSSGRRVKAILPVHILGHPCDMDPILAAAQQYGLPVIEDATEGLGAAYKNRKLGSLGDIACFSFNGNKIITTGGGGMIVTNHEAWANKAKYLTTQAKDDPVEYVHNEIGYNYRLTNIQAAMGCAQMELLDGYIQKKRAIATLYETHLSELGGITPMRSAPWADSIYWMYTVLINEELTDHNSRDVLNRLAALKIQSRPLWRPMPMLPIFEKCQAFQVENAPILYRDALSLPCSVGLTEGDQQRVLAAIQGILG